jgi:hypothetical protein
MAMQKKLVDALKVFMENTVAPTLGEEHPSLHEWKYLSGILSGEPIDHNQIEFYLLMSNKSEVRDGKSKSTSVHKPVSKYSLGFDKSVGSGISSDAAGHHRMGSNLTGDSRKYSPSHLERPCFRTCKTSRTSWCATSRSWRTSTKRTTAFRGSSTHLTAATQMVVKNTCDRVHYIRIAYQKGGEEGSGAQGVVGLGGSAVQVAGLGSVSLGHEEEDELEKGDYDDDGGEDEDEKSVPVGEFLV